MPFLIKSSGGQRTCKLMTNKNQSSATRQDIIDALKGLTFKFEVKIADVVPSSVDEENGSPPVDQREDQGSTSQQEVKKFTLSGDAKVHIDGLDKVRPPVVKEEKKLSDFIDPSKELKDAMMDLNPRPKSIPQEIQGAEEVKALLPEKKQEPEVNSTEVKVIVAEKQFEAPKRPMFTPSQVIERKVELKENKPISEKAQVLPPKTETSEPAMKVEVVSKAPFARGCFKVGSSVITCCLSVDETTSVPTAYVTYNNEKLLGITKLILDKAEKIDEEPEMDVLKQGDIIFARSQDDESWYRAVIEKVGRTSVSVYFFDWGLRETLSAKRIRNLTDPELGLAQYPACALKVQFANESGPLLDEAFKCEQEFKMKVDSYDDVDEVYTATIINILA